MTRFFLLILFTFSFKQAANAQSSHHIGFFPTIDHSGTLSNKWDYSLYYFGGLNIINSEMNGIKEPANFFVLYSEQALTYKLNSHLSFSGSYVFERQYPFETNYRNENRFYVQATYKFNLGRNTLKHRLRYDGRFIQNRLNGEAPFTSRLRYLFGIKTPLQKNKEQFYFSTYNEFFFNTYRSSVSIYGENWAAAAIGVQLNKSNAVEFGPLYIFWVENAKKEMSNFYYLQLAWVSHFDFRKMKQSKI